MNKQYYLDNHSTTPVDPRVLKKMIPFFTDNFGNASSIDHLHGYAAKKEVEEARTSISQILACRKAKEIIFTGGATESNNIALIGTYNKFKNKGNQIISTAIEHPSILDTLEYLKKNGANIIFLSVDKYGMIDLDELESSITEKTILISVMFANNEIGTIQPIEEIGKIAKKHNVIFHTDAAQAVGHEKIHVYDMNVDLLSFSGHKFYGPKGIGGLFIRSFSPFLKITPIIHGGGHERGLRPGTLNVPGIIGLAEALSISNNEMIDENIKIKKMIDKIYSSIKKKIPKVKRNGHPTNRLSHNFSLTIPGIESKALINILKNELSFSAGSACSTTKVEPSHVLKAINIPDEQIHQTIRLGFGRFNKNEDEIADILIKGISTLIG
jgi:cysteine desulfurase